MKVGTKALAATLFGVVALTLNPHAAFAETTLRLISGWSANNPNVPLIEAVFIKNVADASKGELKIQRSGPEVVPPFEQLQPVSAAPCASWLPRHSLPAFAYVNL